MGFALISLILILPSLAFADITTGLISLWTFEGNYTNTGGFTTTPVGNPTFTVGQVGAQQVELDGDDWLHVVRNAALEPARITVAAWVDPGALGSWGHVISRPYTDGATWTSPFASYRMGRNSTNSYSWFDISVGGTRIGVSNPGGTEWTAGGNRFHMAMTYDGTVLRGYINGVEVGNATLVGSLDYTNVANIAIGQRSPNTQAEYVTSGIDQLRIYNRALTVGDIQELVSEVPGGPPPAPVGDYIASPGGAGTACTANQPCSAQFALDMATAGEVITLLDGVYGPLDIDQSNGTNGNPITLQAKNRFQAVLNGNGADTIDISRSWWVIDGLKMINTPRGVDATNAADNNIYRHLRIRDFSTRGMSFVTGSNGNTVQYSYIGPAFGAGDQTGIRNDGNGVIEHTFVYGVETHQDAVTPDDSDGLCIAQHGTGTNGAIARGNIIVGCDKDPVRVFDAASGTTYDSNIFAYNPEMSGHRDSYRSGTTQNQNVFTNNLFRHNYVSFQGKGNLNADNTYDHNTVILSEFSAAGMMAGSQNGAADQGRRFTNNLLYSNIAGCSNGQKLDAHRDFDDDYSQGGFHNNNLFWKNCGNSGNWGSDVGGNYAYDGSDVLAQPVFVNANDGDFTLAAGSPGKGAGTGGTDIGIAYDAYLTLRKARLVHNWETVEVVGLQGNVGTQISGLANGDSYQVWFYHPQNGGTTSTVAFTVEGIGTNLTRDMSIRCCSNTFHLANNQVWNGSARYGHLGVFQQNGTLNVNWNNSNAVSRIFAARTPRDTEGHAWVYPAGYPLTINSASVENATPTAIRVGLLVSGQVPVLPASGCTGFSATKNAASWPISSCTRTLDSELQLNMATPATAGDTIELSYVKASGNVESSVFVPLENVSALAVTNNLFTSTPFASPTGSGSACTNSNPCLLTTAQGVAVSGGKIILKDGTYSWVATTKPSITYQAQNPLGAIIANETTHAGDDSVFRVTHSGTVLDGLHITGQADGDNDFGGGSGHGLIRVTGAINGFTIRNSLVQNSAGELVGFCSTSTQNCSNLLIEDSTFRNAGLTSGGNAHGEGIYVCQFQGANTCTNVTIRRNTVQATLEQHIDIKPGGRNVDIYHNILENQSQISPAYHPDGAIVSQSGDVEIYENIIRNNAATSTSGTSALRLTTNGGIFRDNVVYGNTYTGSFLIRSRADGSGTATLIADNVFCSNTGSTIESVFTNLSNNTFGTGTPAPDCTAKENEILALISGVPPPPASNTFYIQPATGVNATACGTSEAGACKTWAFLLTQNTIGAGDTVCLLNPNGTTELTEQIVIGAGQSGVAGNPVVLDGKCGAQADRGILDGTGLITNNTFAMIDVNGANYVELRDLEVRDLIGTDVRGIRVRGGSTYITITRPKVHNIGTNGAAAAGISFGGFGDQGGYGHLLSGSTPSDRWDESTYDCQLHGSFFNNLKLGQSSATSERSTVTNCALWASVNGVQMHSEKLGRNWTIKGNLFGNSNKVDEDSFSLAWGSNSNDCLSQGQGAVDYIIDSNIFTDVTTPTVVSRDYLGVNGCVQNLVIKNNIFAGTSPGMQMYASVRNVKIYHNTFYVGSWAIRNWEMTDGIELKNNLIWGCVDGTCSGFNRVVHFDANSRQCCQDKNHCLWQDNVIIGDGTNAQAVTMDIQGGGFTSGGCPTSPATGNETSYDEADIATWAAAGWFGATNRTNDSSWGTEPSLVDPDANDFAPQSGDTVVKDQGQVIPEVAVDFNGNPRDGTPDIGAFEVQAEPPPPPPPPVGGLHITGGTTSGGVLQ